LIIPSHRLGEMLGVEEGRLDTTGLKLTVGEIYGFRSRGSLTGEARILPGWEPVRYDDGYLLGPGAYIVRYREEVSVPPRAAAFVFPRSSLLRMGATIYTAVWDPGYRGRGIGLLHVFNPHGIEISLGAHIAQLVYVYLSEESARLYRGAFQGEGLG